nr:dna-directed rna polymerase subunit beta [Quercus suber]
MEYQSERPLYVLPNDAHTGNTYLSTQYTLRHCNIAYREETSSYKNSIHPAEFDCNKTPGKIGSFITFDNLYGHCSGGETRIFDIKHHDSMSSFYDYLSQCMSKTVKRSHAWDLDGVRKLKVAHVLSGSVDTSNDHFMKCLKVQTENDVVPISVHPPHAYIESLSKRGKTSTIFDKPNVSTIVTGKDGGFHNNMSVEMGFKEKEGIKDVHLRTYDRKYLGFLCCGYTSHSSDAGKTRRLCSFTRVRVSSVRPLWSLENCIETIESSGDWTVYCMGSTVCMGLSGICTLIAHLDSGLEKYYATQFDYPNTSYCAAPPTYIVIESKRIMILSISPGSVLRSIPGKSMADSMMIYHQKDSKLVRPIILPRTGDDSIEYYNNPWYLHAPLVKLNRQPRPLFACGQQTQGIFWPWSPATARVSPVVSTSPLVATKYTREMEIDWANNPEAIWDVVAGQDMTVCFMNLPGNYDDSMIVSSKFADLGGFQTISVCTYRISDKDSEPTIGERLCGKNHRWWKMPCPSSCICTSKFKANRYINAGRIPTSIVKEILRTEDGAVSIKILSFSQLLTGDKISMSAGQKGIVHLVDPVDLPLIIMKDGSTFQADLYMAIGSVVSRQTNGIIVESGYGMRAAADGKKSTVGFCDDGNTETCKRLIHPHSGKIIHCQMLNGSIEVMEATVGIIRVMNQTQLTRERHHLTHNSEGKRSLGTAPGRAAGGGVAASEMDFHAMMSSGAYGAAQELFDRGNAVRVPYCTKCNRICIVNDCVDYHPDDIVRVRMSFDVAILDMMSASINRSANVYRIRHV